MKWPIARIVGIAFAASLMGGCKVELYRNLSEAEANTMLARLLLHHIDAEKKVLKGETAQILVEQSQFVDAVEVLRQSGLPRKSPVTIQDLFPSGQLVTSPAQEQAKIIYLKEQELDHMLRSMDGVIDAQVAIAESPSQNRYDPPTPSASVFIKYSPDRNLESRATEIRDLVLKGVPSLRADNISVIMQRADYRFAFHPPQADDRIDARANLGARRIAIVAPFLAVALLLAVAAIVVFRRRRKRGVSA
jgi:type III secretion protein J